MSFSHKANTTTVTNILNQKGRFLILVLHIKDQQGRAVFPLNNTNFMSHKLEYMLINLSNGYSNSCLLTNNRRMVRSILIRNSRPTYVDSGSLILLPAGWRATEVQCRPTMARVLVRILAAALLLFGPCQATVDGITAIYNFGDSLSDTRNFVREGAMGMMRKLPSGITINRATGRCSDGYLMIDDLAKDLGLPLLSPYLDKGADFTHGANFAVTGATALDTPTLARHGVDVLHTNSSLAVQLQWFKDLMNATTKSPQEVRAKLGGSLVLLGEIGGNDYNYTFLVNKKDVVRMTIGAVEAMGLVPEVVRSILNASNAMLEMGATRMVIPGNFRSGARRGTRARWGAAAGPAGGVRRGRVPRGAQPLRAGAQRAAAAGDPGAAGGVPGGHDRLRRLLRGVPADARGRAQAGLRRRRRRRRGLGQGVLWRGRREVQC
ncbi:hypothetical protein BRADI_3g07536v3 [Brachypodium distachyon]|uniref:GDSL esterase/lipase n=1 Tax=Brachypodium distachyon TaxID=15368 RepID=A0A2K2CVS2_BRADI|nr:hypothetical protein BRADI_3g07536v3 [Brachypodium distachyon]